MSQSNKIYVWTHRDLDGLVSLLVVRWAFPNAELDYQATTPMRFREHFQRWLLAHSIEDYNLIFVLDLDVSDNKDLIDQKNVIIIDHHLSHSLDQDYKLAKHKIETKSSACLLTYQTLKKQLKLEFSEAQKLLVVLGDDYDSFKHQTPLSTRLNSLFWITKDNFKVFCELYKNGFTPFTEYQLKLIEQHEKEVDETIDKLQFFEGKNIQISGVGCYIVGAVADKYIDDVGEHILNIYRPDIAIIINPNTNHVSYRRGDNIKLDMSKIAAYLSQGGGHPYAAGGVITKELLELTKKFTPL